MSVGNRVQWRTSTHFLIMSASGTRETLSRPEFQGIQDTTQMENDPGDDKKHIAADREGQPKESVQRAILQELPQPRNEEAGGGMTLYPGFEAGG